MMQRAIYIIGAKRTAIGAFGGSLKNTSSVELGVIATKAAIKQSNIKPELIDTVNFANVIQCSSNDGPYIARHVALKSGLSISVPCLTVNRLCGSGFQSVVNAVQDIRLNDAEISLAGASESMNQAPFFLRNARFGIKFSQTPLTECSIWSTLTDEYIKTPMGITAENLAEKYNISREECDKFALLSQQRWLKSNVSGKFKHEITPVFFKNKNTGENITFEIDEHPKPKTNLEDLAKLKSVFKKNGTTTAGNSSGVCDGGSTIILASELAVKKYNLKPLARVVGYSIVGCDPNIMGIGPAEAIRKLCSINGIPFDKIDLFDVNEAFAAQFLAVQKELGLDINKTNINGGAIALGHPIGMSGNRILVNLTYELFYSKKRYAIGSACIGGGQGIALLLENVNN